MYTHSSIWLKIIDIRAKTNNDGNLLNFQTYNRVMELGILKRRKRGTKGGNRRKNKMRQNYTLNGVNMNNLIYVPLTKTPKSLLNIGCINLRFVLNKSAAFLNSIIDGCYDIVVYTES